MFFFTLFYLLFSFLLIFPPVEFIAAGLTIPSLFEKYLGSEGERFVEYHIRRVMVTLTLHSLLPLGYIVLLSLNSDVSPLHDDEEYAIVWQVYTALAFLLSSIVFWKILNWSGNAWSNHPICLKLGKFCNLGEHWTIVASNVDMEFRRYDKVIIQTSSSKAYITDSWIIKVGLYDVDFAHQDDAILIVNNSDTYDITPTGDTQLQFINVEVKSSAKHVKPFNIRLLAQDFNDLQNKVIRPIIIMPNIVFHKTVIEKFIDVFKDQVALNDKYTYDQELDPCIGCMQETSNIKINKQCVDQNNPPPPNCTQCNCRPMWCVTCMAKWFASRQEQDNTSKWLSSKCSCPVCRAVFCVLDIAYIQTQN